MLKSHKKLNKHRILYWDKKAQLSEDTKHQDSESWKSDSESSDGFIKALARDKMFISPSLTKNGKILNIYDMKNSEALNKNNKYLPKITTKDQNFKEEDDRVKRILDRNFESLLRHDHVSALKHLNRTIDNTLNFWLNI